MNILAIGNSFSEDSMRYLHSIARADGINLQTVNLYIGGCSLERHYRNMLSEAKNYELQCNGQKTGFYVSMKEALLNRKWDIITVHQQSLLSLDKDSYEPYISELAAFIRKCAPKAKIYVHQTWAYEAGSDKLLNVAKYDTPSDMLKDIVSAYSQAAKNINADGIIPSGELLEALCENEIEHIYRDTFHVSRGLGRYALGLLWYHILCKNSVSGNTFRDFDEFVSDKDILTIKKCVDKFEV